MSSRALFAGAGCSVLVTMSYLAPLLSPNHFTVYFYLFPLSNVFLAMLLDVVAIGLLAAAAWSFIERINRRNPLWPVLFAGIVITEVYRLPRFPGWSFSNRSLEVLAGFLLLLAFSFRWWKPVWFGWLIDGAYVSLGILGFSVFWVVPELAYLAFSTSSHETPGFEYAGTRRDVGGPRIVWIVFDELSQDQLYDHRASGLTLPNFDRLRAESLEFTNIQPAGYFTRVVIPSLLTGRRASNMRGSSSGKLDLYFDDTHRWEHFEAGRTIFADARTLGWTTGIVGWTIPYCRLFAGWVDTCYWSDEYPIVDGSEMATQHGVFTNASYPILKFIRAVVPGVRPQNSYYEKNWVAPQTRDYQSIIVRALALAGDRAIRFKFIHLPIPHPPAIYDRHTHAFSSAGSYLDNLALSDMALGQLLDVLAKAPEWSDTTLIVAGDHSWRIDEWRAIHWTAEDQAASKGLFDTRPALLVHLPGQNTAQNFGMESQSLLMHDFLGALLRNLVHSPQDVISSLGHGQPLVSASAR